MEFRMFHDILTVCGWISIIGGALAVIWRQMSPVLNIMHRISDLEEKTEKMSDKVDTLEQMQKQQSKCLAAILNHMITGNGIEHMKDVRDELLNSIIDN